MTEDEMVGWHHQLNGHGFGWTLGVGDGQGGLVCCDSWGCKESDTTEPMVLESVRVSFFYKWLTSFPNIRVFSNESALHIRWPKYWSFSISPSNDFL